jgi:hypothetical protein
MERTADRCVSTFWDDFHIFSPSNARSRQPSLILFSLDGEASRPIHEVQAPSGSLSPAIADLVLVKPMRALRVFPLMLVAVFVAGCSSAASRHVTISRSDDALFWGRMDAVSAADRQTILTTARERLATFAPSFRVGSVKIFSHTEVRVFFGPDSSSSAGDMGLERRGTQWHITDEHAP